MRMADPENGRVERVGSVGPTMYAVEGMVLGVVAAAWVYSPLRSTFAPTPLLDELLVLPVGVMACVNLLLCTIMPNNEPVQAGFFGVALTAFIGYLFVALEAQALPQYATVFFGGVFLFQIPAGISLGLLGVQTLLAAGALSQRLWQHTQWQEAALLLVAALLSCLCIVQNVQIGGVVCLLILVSIGSVSVCVVKPDVRAGGLYIAHLFAFGCLVITSNAVAYASGSTVWVHLTVTALLWLLLLCKFVLPKRPRPAPAQPSPVVVVVPPAGGVLPNGPFQAVAGVNRRAFYVPPSNNSVLANARMHSDAVLFGGLLRSDTPVKKHI